MKEIETNWDQTEHMGSSALSRDAGFDGLVPELRVSNNVIDRMVG